MLLLIHCSQLIVCMCLLWLLLVENILRLSISHCKMVFRLLFCFLLLCQSNILIFLFCHLHVFLHCIFLSSGVYSMIVKSLSNFLLFLRLYIHYMVVLLLLPLLMLCMCFFSSNFLLLCPYLLLLLLVFSDIYPFV